MAKAEASVEELVSMIERGELRLPEMQRQYVWRSTRVRDLLDSLYRGTHRAQSCFGKRMKLCRCRISRSARARILTRARGFCWMASNV
ncbi:PF03235 domain protein [Bordetella bronchiseptica MO211]|nr:PF03235 domain protein [Bordetella bronchiseptica MO211]